MSHLRSALAVILVTLGGTALSASAATTQNLNYKLEFLGHTHFQAEVFDVTYDSDGNPTSITQAFGPGTLHETNDVWGLPRLFPGFAIGDDIAFSAQLSLPDPSGGAPGTVVSCMLGGIDCSQNAPVPSYDPATGDFGLAFGSTVEFYGVLASGNTLNWDALNPNFVSTPQVFSLTATQDAAIWSVLRAEFKVVEELPTLAPVPLPASMLLLPLGLIGLASLRRRKAAAA